MQSDMFAERKALNRSIGWIQFICSIRCQQFAEIMQKRFCTPDKIVHLNIVMSNERGVLSSKSRVMN